MKDVKEDGSDGKSRGAERRGGPHRIESNMARFARCSPLPPPHRFNEGGPDAPLECRVDVGECLFVPHGWWHCVINVEEGGGLNDNVSLALTQNYVSSSNLSDVLRFLEVNKNQISGCRDRGKSAVDPETFGEVRENLARRSDDDGRYI